MTDFSRGTPSLATMEACNALRAEGFRALPETIEIWRFREVLTKLGATLGLSGGAALYALDLMGMLTEADWRGDGRAVTYHSIRGYARKVGKSERTIGGYERQLIMAGLVHRTVRHARRHGGAGNVQRRTGLDWRSFGARMPELLALLAARRAEEERRLDVEARIRAERSIVLGLAEALEEGRTTGVLDELGKIGVLRLRGTVPLADLQARLGALILLRADLAEEAENHADPVDNIAIPAQEAQQSEVLSRPIDNTGNPSCPADIPHREKKKPDIRACGKHRAGMESEGWGRAERTGNGKDAANALSLDTVWQAVPGTWKSAIGKEAGLSWPLLVDIAGHFARRLDIGAHAWSAALRVLGPREAALALIVLDSNRTHPERPVLNIGGALLGMVRRAEEGRLDLASSLYGVIGRKYGRGEGKGHDPAAPVASCFAPRSRESMPYADSRRSTSSFRT